MQSYRLLTNLKSGLVVFAVLIAVASLAYTSRIADQLREREQMVIQLWADAQTEIANTHDELVNPFLPELISLATWLETAPELEAAQRRDFSDAVLWAQSMPPAGENSFIANSILLRQNDFAFAIPSILTDATGPVSWRHIPVEVNLETADDSAAAFSQLTKYREEMDAQNPPIPIEIDADTLGTLRNYIHYGESALIRELQLFPYIQMLFIGLFVAVGYLSFSYVRRSEQRNLWVGMAKEAAHQLGTPISSLMGWTTLLKDPTSGAEQAASAVKEIDNDIQRLQRIAHRFSNIGSQPQLLTQPLAPLIAGMVAYIQRRIPQQGKKVVLMADVPDRLGASLNAELFEWVIENLLKNALDAIETDEGKITLKAYQHKDQVFIDVQDTGKGIDRREWKNIFRPGYSTKKRGWGLGLSLAKRIVDEYHGGKIEVVQSKPGEGTTIRISLPAMQLLHQ